MEGYFYDYIQRLPDVSREIINMLDNLKIHNYLDNELYFININTQDKIHISEVLYSIVYKFSIFYRELTYDAISEINDPYFDSYREWHITNLDNFDNIFDKNEYERYFDIMIRLFNKIIEYLNPENEEYIQFIEQLSTFSMTKWNNLLNYLNNYKVYLEFLTSKNRVERIPESGFGRKNESLQDMMIKERLPDQLKHVLSMLKKLKKKKYDFSDKRLYFISDEDQPSVPVGKALKTLIIRFKKYINKLVTKKKSKLRSKIFGKYHEDEILKDFDQYEYEFYFDSMIYVFDNIKKLLKKKDKLLINTLKKYKRNRWQKMSNLLLDILIYLEFLINRTYVDEDYYY